jgi:hypothetical protein
VKSERYIIVPILSPVLSNTKYRVYLYTFFWNSKWFKKSLKIPSAEYISVHFSGIQNGVKKSWKIPNG